jgi:Na+-translocating ferredoxin:NAD+ oxidoreductase RNF subunit RnfB
VAPSSGIGNPQLFATLPMDQTMVEEPFRQWVISELCWTCVHPVRTCTVSVVCTFTY